MDPPAPPDDRSAFPPRSSRADLLLALYVCAVGAIPIFLLPPNHDVAWYHHLAQRLLDGAVLNVDLIDTNPPLISWFTLPLAALARAVGDNRQIIYRALFCLLIAASLLVCRRLLRPFTDAAGPPHRLLLLPLLAFLLLPHTGYAFGQREHLLVILLLPYVLLHANHGASRRKGDESNLCEKGDESNFAGAPPLNEAESRYGKGDESNFAGAPPLSGAESRPVGMERRGRVGDGLALSAPDLTPPPAHRLPVALTFTIGLAAGLGLAFKHYFLLCPLALELWRLRDPAARRLRELFRPENAAIALVLIVYAALVARSNYPPIAAMALRLYHGFDVSWPRLLLNPTPFLVLAALVITLGTALRTPRHSARSLESQSPDDTRHADSMSCHPEREPVILSEAKDLESHVAPSTPTDSSGHPERSEGSRITSPVQHADTSDIPHPISNIDSVILSASEGSRIAPPEQHADPRPTARIPHSAFRIPHFLVTAFLLASLALLAAALAQRKGWNYHFYPARVFALLAISVALLDLLHRARPNIVPRGRAIIGAILLLAPLLAFVAGDFTLGALTGTARRYSRLADAVRRFAAPGDPILVLSTGIAPAFPLVNNTGTLWSSRFAHLWPIPGFYSQVPADVDPFPYHPPERWSADERYLFDAVVEDLRRYRPVLVLVRESERPPLGLRNARFDFVDYFSQDDRFRQIWKDYLPAGRLPDRHLLYLRADRAPRRPGTDDRSVGNPAPNSR